MAEARPWWGAAAGLVIGVGVAAALSAAGLPHRPEALSVTNRPGGDTGAVAAFLAAWARSRAVTYAADTTFSRTVDGRTVISTDGFEARRPPQWVERQGDSWTGLVGGHRVACNAAVDGNFRCTSSAAPADYRSDVAQELQAFSSWLVDPASYDVTRQGNCFALERVRPVLAPPLGDRAQYCFDDAGVPVDTQITRATAVDHKALSHVRSSVADVDLEAHGVNRIGP